MRQNPASRFEYLIKESRADTLDISNTVGCGPTTVPQTQRLEPGHKSDRVLNIKFIEYTGEFSWSVRPIADQVK